MYTERQLQCVDIIRKTMDINNESAWDLICAENEIELYEFGDIYKLYSALEIDGEILVNDIDVERINIDMIDKNKMLNEYGWVISDNIKKWSIIQLMQVCEEMGWKLEITNIVKHCK